MISHFLIWGAPPLSALFADRVGAAWSGIRPVAHISRCAHLPLANVIGLLRCAIGRKAHSYRGPFRTEHLPVTGVTDADTELIGECA